MGFGSSRHAYADANCYGHCNQYADSYSAANSDRLANSNIHTNCYCDIHSNSYSDSNRFAYGYALRYAAMHAWLVGGRGFPQRSGPLGGCLFLWGLGHKVLRHGRALGRYSRKRLHASV